MNDAIDRTSTHIGSTLLMSVASIVMAHWANRCFEIAEGVVDATGVHMSHIDAMGTLFCVGFGACVGCIVFTSLRFAFSFR